MWYGPMIHRSGLCIENPKTSPRSGLPASYSQAWGRFRYDLGAISWYSAGPLIHITGRITANEYLDILNDE